mmetsp:Transcript_7445/g.18672  ORF Transcript_7445/g.18672 Transcript_7445/m.18672 type:complete len:236 (-) Transcript_7445:218-925(-)
MQAPCENRLARLKHIMMCKLSDDRKHPLHNMRRGSLWSDRPSMPHAHRRLGSMSNLLACRVAFQELLHQRMLTDEVHLARSRVQDGSMQLQAAILRSISDDRGVNQKLLDGVESVQLCGCVFHLQLATSCGRSGGSSGCIGNCLHAAGHDLIENMAHGLRRQLCTLDLLQGGTHDFVPRVADNQQNLRREARDRELQGGEHCTAGMSCDIADASLNEHLPRLAVKDVIVRNPQIR